MSPKKQGKYRFHDFEVDLAHRSLRRAGDTVTVDSRTFDLLTFMVLKSQRVITGRPYGSSHQRGRWQVTITTAVLVVLGCGAVFLWRSMPRPLPESLSLVLADFDNTTGNPLFDPALKTAFTIDLGQSPYLKIATSEQIRSRRPQSKTADSQSATPRLTGALARDACQRLNGQVYLTGAVRSLGSKFMVTIRAFGCPDDKSLATSRGIAESPDALLAVLDKVAVDLRRQLGELPQSIGGFSKPLFSDRPANLDAFKSYSDARLLRLDGKLDASRTLLQRAVEIDPQFGLAFAELGALYSELGQRELAIAALTRAFELRNSVDELHRLQIVAAYNDLVTGDILASLHSYKDWSDEYPRNPTPLVVLAYRETQVGKPDLALDSAQHALKLNPLDPTSYTILARSQLSLGQFDAAASTCQLAIGRQVDGEQIHGILLQIAFHRLDQPGIDAQIAWAKGKPAEPFMLLQQALMDFAQGKAKAAEEVFANAVDAYRKQGQTEAVSRTLSAMPRMEAELGLTEIAYALLTRMPQDDQASESTESSSFSASVTGGPADIPVAWAQTGEASRAQALLKSELDAHPTSTLWQEDFAAQIKAAIALNQKRPEEAVDDLKPAIPFDLRSFEVPALRGRAYLAAKRPELAEVEFHKILDHAGVEPLSLNLPLAQLGLARALAQEGKTSEAGSAYKSVFQLWKDADSDLPRLKEAKAEYARLGVAPVKALSKAPTGSSPAPSLARP